MYTRDLKQREPMVIKGDSMDEQNEGLMSAAEDVLKAVHGADAGALMNALQAFFMICDAQPHEEGDHMSEGGEVGIMGDTGPSLQARQASKRGEFY